MGDNGKMNMETLTGDVNKTTFMCFSGMEEAFVQQMWDQQKIENQKDRELKLSIAKIGGVIGGLTLIAGLAETVLKHKDNKATVNAINGLTDAVNSINGIVQVK